MTRGVHEAFSDFFAAPPKARAPAPRIPTYTALKATGFADPDRARENLRLVLEGRPLIPYAEPLRRALHAIFPVLLDALWQSPDPDEALNQFERFVAAAGPRTAYLELRRSARAPAISSKAVRPGRAPDPAPAAQPELLTGLADPRHSRASPPAAFRDAVARRWAASHAGRSGWTAWRRSSRPGARCHMAHALGVTDAEKFSREMTALAEAALPPHG